MKTLLKLNLLFICLVLSFNLVAQEHDFHKHAYKFIKASDHQNDARVHQYDVGFYFLDLELDNNDVDISGNTRIDLNLESDYANELVFELKSNLTVDSITVNGVIKSYSHSNDIVVIDYTHGADFNENYQVSAIVYYHGSPSEGMFNSYDYFSGGGFNFTYSLTEPYFAKYWFPCKQILTDKADSSYFYVTIPDDLKAGSNGILVDEYNIGGGKKRMEWQSSYPIVYYLISIAVADYQDYSFNADLTDFGESVLIQNYIPNNASYLNDNDWYINRTSEMMVVLSDKWGIYPHYQEKYGHCIVPLGGGMEHQTMTTLGDFDFRLVMHELAHSWFGDYVTCATWQDIWVNEGFASYGEYLGEEFIQPDGYELGWLNQAQSLAKEMPTGSVFVPFEEINDVGRIFNYHLSYRKGACLVHMIRYMINDDELFFSTLQTFLAMYGNSTATGDDLKDVLESETGIDFDPFFDEWYYGEGYPTYSVEWYQVGSTLHIESTETTTSPSTTLFTIPIEFKITYEDDSEEIIRKDVDANFSSYEVPVTGIVTEIETNPTVAVLADVSTIQKTENNRIPDRLKVFPNPSHGTFTVFTNFTEDYNIQLIDMTGKVIKSSIYENQILSIDYSDVSSGVYFLKMSTEEESHIEKIIIE